MEQTKKAVIYARQSSGEEENSASIARQIENCQYLAKTNGFTIVGIFQDANTSGRTYPAGNEAERLASMDTVYNAWFDNQTKTKKFRTGLKDALNALDNGYCLIVDDVTRLYRPLQGSFQESFINGKINEKHVEILQVKGGEINLTRFDQTLVNFIRNLIEDEETKKKRQKSIQQLKYRRNNGYFANGGGKAFGTEYNHANGSITIKAEYIPCIQYVFNSIASNMPTMQVLKGLNENFAGLVQKVFYASHIYNISSNPIYAGYQFNSDGELIANKQITNPCIDFALFGKVQSIMQEKKTGHRKEKFRWLPLSGMLYCGYCGSRLLANTEKRKNSEMTAYSCQISNHAGKDTCKEKSRINFSLNKENYVGLFEAVKPLLVISLFDLLDAKEKAEKASQNMETLQVELNNLQARKAKIRESYIAGLLTDDELQSDLQTITEKINAVKQELITAGNSNPDATTMHFNALYKRFKAESFMEGEMERAEYETCLKQSIKRIDVFFDHVDVETIYGKVSIPRYMVKNKRNMPVPELVINGKNELTAIITYKTGKKAVLADWGRIKIVTR